jgi:hypothetical protein
LGDAGMGSWFGFRVATNSSGTVLIMGGPFESNNGGIKAGAAMVYTGSAAGGWQLREKLTPLNANNAHFGSSVDTNSDGTLIIIGVPLDKYVEGGSFGITGGSAMVYTGSAVGGWQLNKKIWGDGGESDHYGIDVATNSDGTLLMVGGYLDDNITSEAGAALVYTGSAVNGWQLNQKLTGDIASGRLGWGVATNSSGTVLMTNGLYGALFVYSSFLPTEFRITNVTIDSISYAWNPVAGATSYQLDVSTGIAFNNFINGYNNRTVNSVSQSVTGLVGGRTYYARVRAFNTTNGPGVNSSILTQATSPFIASTPTNLRISRVNDDRSIFWTWDPVPGTESYAFTLEGLPNSPSPPIGVIPVATNPFGPTSYTQTQGNPNTTYYFKVRTQSPGVSNFTAESAQTTALPVLDINGVAAGRTSTSISLNWNPVATSPHSYIVEISRSFLSWLDPITYPLLATNIVTYQTSVTPSTIFSNLLPNTMHYIRFKTSNANGISRLSDRIDIATFA